MNSFMTDVLATGWAIAFIVLPALPGAFALSRMLSAGAPTVFITSFAISLAGSWAASMASQLLGTSMRTSMFGHLAAVAAIDALLLLWAWRRRSGRLHLDWPGLAIMFGVALLALIEQPWFAPNVDAFYHVAAARSLTYFDSAMVTDPFYGVGYVGTKLADPTAGSLHVLLAFAARAAKMDPAQMWAGLNALAAMVMPAAAWTLFRQLKARRAHQIISVVALCFLGFVGDYRFVAYPNQIGPSFVILAVAGLASVVSRERAGLALVAVASVAAASIHTGVAVSLAVALGIVGASLLAFAAFVKRKGGDPGGISRRVLLAGAIAAVLAAAAALPRMWFLWRSSYAGASASDAAAGPSVAGLFNMFGIDLFFYPQAALRGGDVMALMGTALAVVCLIEAVKRRDAMLVIAGSFALSPIILGFNPVTTPVFVFVSPYVTWRTLDLMWYGPYIAFPHGIRLRPALGAIALLGAVLTALPAMHMLFSDSPPVAIRPGVMNVSLWQGWQKDFRYAPGGESLDELERIFGEDWPLIATDDMTGYNIAGLLPCRTVAVTGIHAPVFMEFDELGARRRRAMDGLLKYRSSPERRRQIIRWTKPDYVLMWPGRVAPQARSAIIADEELFEVVYNRDGVVLLRVRTIPSE